MDIGGWLRELGLERYEQAFRDNEIDLRVLPELTAEDLRELGVAAIGHRRLLLKAIADLAAGAGRAAPEHVPAASPANATADAERRQLTVMFCDLVGSTGIAARLDPEDLREVITAYHRAVAEVVAGFDGFVAKYMGDGVLVYFGYPRAHEDDPERAVRVGLGVVDAVRRLNVKSVMLQARVGIATGLVVVGDLIGEGSAQEQSVVGETPNLAARLQALAESNAVVIAAGTRRLLGDLFEYRDLGTVTVKGFDPPVAAWQVLRPSAVASRFEALRGSGFSPLVGRDEEIDLLLRRWERAKAGDGQVVLVSGEPGIGKSRLTAVVLESLATEPHTRLRYFCSPQHADSAFYPIMGQLERAAGLARDDTPQARLDKFDTMLTQTSTSPQDAALLAELLSLPNDGRYPTIDMAPQQRRQRTLDALISQLQVLARQNPVLMVFEDAHWTDPTSLEVLGHAVSRIATLRVLLIVTFRPEFDPPWIGRPHVTALTINRLAERDVGAMVDGVVGNKFVPTSIRQDIIERSDGIPLFVEEMTKAVLEAEDEGAAERLVATVPAPGLAVPPSLHASLMARLDRLGPAREIAQVGAAIGREFTRSLVVAVAPQPERELSASLDSLTQAGLLFRQGAPPHSTYLFKHALVRDAAYGTLMREQRRALHARIAMALEGQFADIVEAQPELLAHHCAEAGLLQKAASLWGAAGQRSLTRSALVEAVAQLTRALAQIAALPGTPALRREQIKLQVALITPLLHVKGYAAPETKAAAEQALALIEQAEALGEPPEHPLLLFSVLYGVWTSNYVACNGDAVRNLSAQFLTLAAKQHAAAPLLIAHRIVGISLAFAGELAKSREHFDRAMALYDPAEHRPLATRFSVDTAVSVLSYRSWDLWILGYPEKALVDAEQAISAARGIGQAATLMYALWHVSVTQTECGNYERANAQLEEAIALADEKGASYWKGMATMAQGRVLALTGDASTAIRVIGLGIAATRSLGGRQTFPAHMSSLARAYAEAGQFDDALQTIAEAATEIEATKQGWWESEVNRIGGEIALMSPERATARAEVYFERALAVARQQRAKSWELRAAMSMARLWRDQGKPQQARELLAPVYGWFTEGFDTPDLKAAKALLEALGPYS
jgi:predicted ATPase/class 3 adenylate cyclase